MAVVSYAIRVLPLTLIRKQIKNRFIQSFLYYVPYVTLSVMTFPAIIEATQSPLSGAIALAVGIAAGSVQSSGFVLLCRFYSRIVLHLTRFRAQHLFCPSPTLFLLILTRRHHFASAIHLKREFV